MNTCYTSYGYDPQGKRVLQQTGLSAPYPTLNSAPQRLDAVCTLLGIKKHFPKIVRAAVMPWSTLSWGITFTRRPAAINWSRTLRPVCRDGVPPSQGKQSVP